MPELLEAEAYRAELARAVGWTVESVAAAPGYIRGGLSPDQLADALHGDVLDTVFRRGKVVVCQFGTGELALRFGMTGRIRVGGVQPVNELLYSGRGVRPEWIRATIACAEGNIELIDPRRLGSLEWQPDLSRLGPDAVSLTVDNLRAALSGQVAVKARLMDQNRVAGLGNLLTDDILWRAGVAPTRAAGSLGDEDVRSIHRAIAATLSELGSRGGSHTSQLQSERQPGGRCPVDGHELRRVVVGGRTTWWCPGHQV